MSDSTGLVVGAIAGGLLTLGGQWVTDYRTSKAAKRQVRAQLQNLMTIPAVGLKGVPISDHPVTVETIAEFSALVASKDVTLAYNDKQCAALLYLEQVARTIQGSIAEYANGVPAESVKKECGLLLYRYEEFAALAGLKDDYDVIAHGLSEQIRAARDTFREAPPNENP